MNKLKDKVLVTGASGYIAMHCILELLKSGYAVKASLRDLNKEFEIRKIFDNYIADNEIEFCKLNLLIDEGWTEAALDCDYMLHIASPFVIEEPNDENELIEPALQGTLRALNAAKNSKIKKVVLTSSMASIAYGHKKDTVNSNDWTDISKEVGAYIKSKTIAEKAAWDFVNNQNDVSFALTTIHPGMVFGPLLNEHYEGASVNLIRKMITGKFPALPEIHFTVVDVRDVAKLHVQALKKDKTDNKRIIATSKNGVPFLDVAKILIELGYSKCPTNLIPNQVINSLAPFNKGMRSTSVMVKRGCYGTDISETVSLFNWEPITLRKTLDDMVKSL
tara:strand:- start:606 stop:1607 length:1002 start_codon:yes stop_codon:yes gene_type:complete